MNFQSQLTGDKYDFSKALLQGAGLRSTKQKLAPAEPQDGQLSPVDIVVRVRG